MHRHGQKVDKTHPLSGSPLSNEKLQLYMYANKKILKAV